MKKLLLLALTIGTLETGFAQSDYRTGYVVTNRGDTLKGLIPYREGSKAYKFVTFKTKENQEAVTYLPPEIKGYGFENDKFFQSKTIAIKDETPKEVFLEVITRGTVSLYRYEKFFFVEKEDRGAQQLINESRQVEINGRRVLRNSNQHISTLNILLYDCPEVIAQVQKSRLDEKSLTHLIETYNKCKGAPGITFKEKKPFTKAIAGLVAGTNISQLEFERHVSHRELPGDFEVSAVPVIGISFDVLSPRISERISLNANVLYVNPTYHGYSIHNGTYYTERNYFTIKLSQLRLPISVRYTLINKNFNPYINFGICGTVHARSSLIWVQEVESNNTVQIYHNETQPGKTTQFGLWAGSGVIRSINKRLDVLVELRYEQTNGVSRTPGRTLAGPKSKVTNFQILVGLRIK